MAFEADLEEIHPTTPAEWRQWLADNHADAQGVWLIYYRASTGKRELSWEEAVREALCFGWIDSKVQPIDDERYRQVFTPRKPKSVWSKVNKQHVEELAASGEMTPAGQRAIDVAKANGAWAFLEPIDALLVPDDLDATLRQSAGARSGYERRSDSDKRALLYRVYSAKRAETRAKRIAAIIAELEADGPDPSPEHSGSRRAD